MPRAIVMELGKSFAIEPLSPFWLPLVVFCSGACCKMLYILGEWLVSLSLSTPGLSLGMTCTRFVLCRPDPYMGLTQI